MPAADELHFFALFPPADVAAQAAALAPGSARPEKLHITLLVPEHPVDAAALQRAGAAVAGSSFAVLLDRSESGFGASRCRILAPDAATTLSLHALHERLREAVLAQGQRLLREDYRPHLTLARGADAAPPRAIAPIRWQAESFCLMRSLRREGRYVVEARWPLPAAAGVPGQ